MEETGVSGENHRPVPSHCQILSHNVVSSTPRRDLHSVLDLYVVVSIKKHNNIFPLAGLKR